jgi:hypothetical protein
MIFKYLSHFGIMKQDLLATGDKDSIVMRSYEAFKDLKQLSLVLGLDKPITISFAEGSGEAIDENESHTEEESEAD